MKKIFSTILLITILLSNFTVGVKAIDVPDVPYTPSAPSIPNAPEVPTSPVSPVNPTSQPVPTNIPEQPKPTSTPKPPKPTDTPQEPIATVTTHPTPLPTPPPGIQSGNQSSNGGAGDNAVTTGDANISATAVAIDNSNSSSNSSPESTLGLLVDNTGNGANSSNDSSATVVDSATTIQDNQANIQNNLNQSSVSGNNSVSYNTGGEASITTGDSNVSGTAITAVNTNIDGVSVSEFNIADDHRGNFVLDFAANCILNCGSGSAEAANSGNGAGSSNASTVAQSSSDVTFQNNDAVVGNNLVLKADSGNNDTQANTGGDSNITTGDANVSANALTFANNNLSGNVIYGVVNIYGDLVGDIVFPEELLSTCCGNSSSVENSKNGANSVNTASVTQNSNDSTLQSNQANIENNVALSSNTGDNAAIGNTDGASTILTGDSNANAQVLNIANNNLIGDDMWLVLVNNAGTWTGQIMGAPTGQNFAGSLGTQFIVGPSGEITASNTGNGADSTNTSSVTQNSDSTTLQTNTANVKNNLDLSANTGNNASNFNTGGSSNIQTGDATIVANLVNFVNNNVSGGGKLMVTVINVFGSWIGNLVTPGHTPTPEPEAAAVGGSEVVTSSTTIAPTPAPTTTATNVTSTSIADIQLTSKKPAVRGFFTEIEASTDPVLAYSPADAAVSSSVKSAPVKNPIKINLAWLLLVFPMLGIIRIIKAKRSPLVA